MMKVLRISGFVILGIVVVIATSGFILIDRGNTLFHSASTDGMREVFNVLLVGIDSPGDQDQGNSDALILLSVNRKTSTITVTSLSRDIYVKIPGQPRGNSLGTSYALGGPALLLETIRENFKIQVDKYIAVNIFSFIKIIDQLGGVTVDISGAEIRIANEYIKEINTLQSMPCDDSLLTAPGIQHFSGKQALGYVRGCDAGNHDIGRTGRQRMVLSLVFDKVKTLSFKQLDGFLNAALPEIRTNLEQSEILSVLLSVPTLAGYGVNSWSIPKDGTFSLLIIRGMDVLGIDFDQNISEMHRKIYGYIGQATTSRSCEITCDRRSCRK